jgi:outer membrane protein assembly factor BamB
MKTRFLFVLLTALSVAAATALAADWPQWRGPDRTGVSRETGLLKSWPKEGPTLMWTARTLGIGFSGPAVVGDRLYTMGARDEMTYVIALDVSKGNEVWSTKIGPIFTFEGNTWGDGPRSTPTVDGDRLYALDGTGELVCLDTAKGGIVWRKNLIKDFGGEMMTEWGYSESPLVDGDLLICTPGGDKGTLAALNKKTGEVVWRSSELKNKAPYSSVMLGMGAGKRQYVQTSYIDEIKGGQVSGFSTADGKLLWIQPMFKGHSYAIAPTPILRDDLVYVTSGYGGGCHLFALSPKGKTVASKDVYSKKIQKTVKNTHGGVVLVGDHVYGHSEGLGWVCQELKTGEVAWKEKNKLSCQSGSITCADGRLYLYSDIGATVLLEANPKEWQESGRFQIPEKSKLGPARRTGRSAKIWTPPVVANGRLYLRDQELLFCYDVAEKK